MSFHIATLFEVTGHTNTEMKFPPQMWQGDNSGSMECRVNVELGPALLRMRHAQSALAKFRCV